MWKNFTLSSAIEHVRILPKYFTLSNAKINITHNRDNNVLRNNNYDYD